MVRARKFVIIVNIIFAAVASFVTAPRAYGLDCGVYLASTCINSDTLWPHAGAGDWTSVGGTDTVRKGAFALGMVASYQSRPIVLHVGSPGPPGTDFHAIDNQVNGNFLFAYGVTSHLEVDLVVPVTFAQTGTGASPITGGSGLDISAVRDTRFGLTYAFKPIKPTTEITTVMWGLAGRFEVVAPTGDFTQFAGEGSAVFAPSIAAELRIARFSAGVETGARLRETQELSGARVGSQISAAVGVRYDLLRRRDRLSIAAEMRALPTVVSQSDSSRSPVSGLVSTPNGRSLVPAEWMATVASAPWGRNGWSFQIGGGSAVPIGDDNVTTPRFRFILGVRYAPRS